MIKACEKASKTLIRDFGEVENLQVRFRSMFGSIEEGNKAFDNMATFASNSKISESITFICCSRINNFLCKSFWLSVILPNISFSL